MKKCLLGVVTYNRCEMTKQCLDSLFETVDRELCTVMIVDNGSTDETRSYLEGLTDPLIESIHYNETNLGTARALNRVWKIAHDRGQHAGKIDNDVTWYPDQKWISKMLYVLETTEDVGLVGLKREDLAEKPNAKPGSWYKSELFALPDQIIELSNHVIGTCWLVSNKLLKAIGGLKQPGPYGLDDALFCHRAHLAGFVTAFVPDVAIEHIDPGHSKYPEYTQWKIDSVTEDMQTHKYDEMRDAYSAKTRSLYEDFDVG